MPRTIHRELVTELPCEGRGFEGNSTTERPEFWLYRPTGTIVMNDGKFEHWINPGERYRIGWDGVGWRVTCEIWDAHVRRLADEDGNFVSALMVDGAGMFALVQGEEYEINMRDGAPGTMGLYKIT